jgi:glyoxylase-like metal-dependent hydrolase (beta-lactamase superfamily II)
VASVRESGLVRAALVGAIVKRLGVLLIPLVVGIAFAQQPPDPDKVEVKTTAVAGSVSMLEGEGGNIGVSVGDDGVFIVDDEFAVLAPKIKAALARLSPKPVRFVFNTHWHGDHTGANEAMATAGAIIVAHDNVRKRLSTAQFMEFLNQVVPPSPPKALPVITFNDEVSFHLNGDDIHVLHVPNAHTDGDAIVYFTKADVVHMGDVFFTNGSYPLIDFSTGGTIDGYIAALEKMLGVIGQKTKIIPGHGHLSDKAALQRTHDMVKDIRDAVAKLAAGGKSLAQVIAAHPTARWDAEWGHGYIKPEMFVTMIYKTLPKKGRL